MTAARVPAGVPVAWRTLGHLTWWGTELRPIVQTTHLAHLEVNR